MFNWLTKYARAHVRGRRRGGEFVALLPHFQLFDAAMQTLGGEARPMDRRIVGALRLCDGTRTLEAAARQAGVSATRLARLHQRGMLVLWPTAIPRQPPVLPEISDSTRLKIIISPHLDDAALSLGGMMLLWQRAEFRVLVVNVFSRSAWWRFDSAEAQKIIAVRAAEEDLAMRLAAANVQMLDLPEALQRGHSMENVFTAAAGAADQAATERIEEAVGSLCVRFPDAQWLLPLGLGGHVDHRICRDAAWRTLARCNRSKRAAFYEDQPYAAEGDRKQIKSIPNMLAHLRPDRLQPAEYRLVDALPLKLELLRVYWSQFTWSRIAAVGGYARQMSRDGAAERVWAWDI